MVGEFLFWERWIYRRGRRERRGGQGIFGRYGGRGGCFATGATLRLRSGQAASAATQSLGLWSGIVPIRTIKFLSKGQMSHEKNKAVEKFECRGLGNVPSVPISRRGWAVKNFWARGRRRWLCLPLLRDMNCEAALRWTTDGGGPHRVVAETNKSAIELQA